MIRSFSSREKMSQPRSPRWVCSMTVGMMKLWGGIESPLASEEELRRSFIIPSLSSLSLSLLLSLGGRLGRREDQTVWILLGDLSLRDQQIKRLLFQELLAQTRQLSFALEIRAQLLRVLLPRGRQLADALLQSGVADRDPFALGDRLQQDRSARLRLGLAAELLLHLVDVDGARFQARLHVDAGHHQLLQGAVHDRARVAIDQRGPDREHVARHQLLHQLRAQLAVDALAVRLAKALADLVLQPLQRRGLAGVLRELVSQRALLLLAGILDGHAQVHALARQLLLGKVLGQRVLDLEVGGVQRHALQVVGQARQGPAVLVFQIDADVVALDLVVSHAAVDLDHQQVGRLGVGAALDRLVLGQPLPVALDGRRHLLLVQLHGSALQLDAGVALRLDLRLDLDLRPETQRLAGLELDLVDLQRRHRLDLLLLDGLADGGLDQLLRHVVLDVLAVQLLDDVPGHLAGAEPLQPHLPTQVVVRLVQAGGDVAPGDLEIDAFFYRGNVFNRELHGTGRNRYPCRRREARAPVSVVSAGAARHRSKDCG